MDEFRDFEAYMNRVECWGKYSGIVKVIPPKEWRDALPSVKDELPSVQIKSPIEQVMLGQTGLFRVQNMERRKTMSVREWAEFCTQPEYRAPSIEEVGLHARTNVKVMTRRTRKSKLAAKADASDPDKATQVHIKDEPVDDGLADNFNPSSHSVTPAAEEDVKPKVRNRKQASKLTKEEKEADRTEKDAAFLDTFDPHEDWLPFNTRPEDYTPEFCAKLERHYWRNLGLGKAPWYGADTQGTSLYSDDTQEWNVAHLESELTRLLPSSDQGLPGVNTPYLYWGMWRATFAWHLSTIFHFGAPKFWYAVPQGRAGALEQTMRSQFLNIRSQCPQFLRHKSFLASPTLLAKSSCKPNTMVQHAGEFIITYPRGYHAGFNLGLNCAESVNFALKSWIEIGKVAKACKCISDSVIIDRATPSMAPTKRSPTKAKREEFYVSIPPLSKNKRKATAAVATEPPAKKSRKSTKGPTITIPSGSHETKPYPKLSIKLKLPKPEVFPCCLCISMSNEGLLRVHDPPFGRKEALEACSNPATWVDEVETASGEKEMVVFGVDGIVKDRWNLKCAACTRTRPKCHGAPIQCTRGKCLKAFHVSCAREGKDNNIVFNVLREVEKEVVLLDANSKPVPPAPLPSHMQVDGTSAHFPIPSGSNDAAGMVKEQSEVPKIIKKVEVQVLCFQHNPAVAAAKKASKQDKIKSELFALPPMSRIKLRVSAGVFEVSLVRVIEESGSVEVLWDRGLKREFKWGSVVFGSIDGPIQQKPSEPAPDPPQPANNTIALAAYSSSSAAVSANYRPAEPSSTSTYQTTATQYPYSTYSYRNYQPQPQSQPAHVSQQAGAASTSTQFPNYYPAAGGSSTLAPLPYPAQSQYYGGQYHQPSNIAQSHPTSMLTHNIASVRHLPPTSNNSTPAPASNPSYHSASSSTTPIQTNALAFPSPTMQTSAPNPIPHTQTPSTTYPPPQPSHEVTAQAPSQVKAALVDFQYLQALPPEQLAHLIQSNAELRNLFQSALASGNS
ncbi:JmjC-domain-containing protein [Gymnopus androsaceus JB14]|uniref:JmjC-domain-containing protein n=1 Tax=Gymnopus androsaceus JB14 TaxID=1447944 RepID=A0A6A4IHF5_9AGAR|nr:JmjC-domain-containing protein [Gymnopus androsaceus JB14]